MIWSSCSDFGLCQLDNGEVKPCGFLVCATLGHMFCSFLIYIYVSVLLVSFGHSFLLLLFCRWTLLC